MLITSSPPHHSSRLITPLHRITSFAAADEWFTRTDGSTTLLITLLITLLTTLLSTLLTTLPITLLTTLLITLPISLESKREPHRQPGPLHPHLVCLIRLTLPPLQVQLQVQPFPPPALRMSLQIH